MPPGRDLIIRLYGLALQIMVVGLYWLALGRDSVVRTEMGKQASCAKMYEHIVQYDKC